MFIFSTINIVYGVFPLQDRSPYGVFYKSPLYLKIKEKITFIGPSEKSFADYLAEPYGDSSRYDQLEEKQKNTLIYLIACFDNLNEQIQFSIKCNCASHENGNIEELITIIDLISQEIEIK